MMSNLPLILAGPILRRVDSHRVCVWIATSRKVTITMDILQRVESTSNNADYGTKDIDKESESLDSDRVQISHSSFSRGRKRRTKGINHIGGGRNSYIQLGNCL